MADSFRPALFLFSRDVPATAVEKGQAEGGDEGDIGEEGGDAGKEKEDTSGEGKIDGDAPGAEGPKDEGPVENLLRFKVEMDIGLETRWVMNVFVGA